MPKSVKKNMNRKNQRTKRKQFKRTNKKHGERKLRTNKKQLRRNKRTKRKIRGGSQPGYGFGSGFEDNASVESVDSGVGGVGKDDPFAEFERLLDQSLEHGKKLGLQCNPSRFPFGGTKGLECRVKGVIETIDKYLTDKDKLKQNKVLMKKHGEEMSVIFVDASLTHFMYKKSTKGTIKKAALSSLVFK